MIELGEIEIEGIEVFGDEYLIQMLARTRGQDSRVDIGKVRCSTWRAYGAAGWAGFALS